MATVKGVWVFSDNNLVDGSQGIFGYTTFEQSVNFASNGQTFSMMKADGSNIYYGSLLVYELEMVCWNTVDRAYQTVDFGSSEQTVSDDFRTFLTTFATQQASEPTPTVKDLTNTTWYIPAGWTATAGYGKFSVDCSSGHGSGDGFYIGYYDAEGMGFVTSTANRVGVFADEFPIHCPPNSDSFTLTIAGGDDASNASLISWLETNGELQSSGDDSGGDDSGSGTVTITYNGAVIASLKAGQSASLPCKDKPMRTDVVVTVPEGMGSGEAVEEWDRSYTITSNS